jgi:hypothetical protein
MITTHAVFQISPHGNVKVPVGTWKSLCAEMFIIEKADIHVLLYYATKDVIDQIRCLNLGEYT